MATPSYMNPKSDMTLREALAELHALEGDVTPDIVSADLAAALTAHDAVHVLFGCDITDQDEVLAHVWMLAGTDASLKALHAVTRDQDHQRYATGFAHGRRLWTVFKALPVIASVLLRVVRMKKKWPFTEYGARMDRTLCDLREEFGIHLPEPAKRAARHRRGPHHPPVIQQG